MAKIRPYESDFVPSLEVNTARASGGNDGQGLLALGSGIMAAAEGVDSYITRSEIGDAAKQTSDVSVQSFTKLKDMQAPLDDEGMQKFMSDYDEAMNKIAANMTTGRANEYFQRHYATDREQTFKALISRNAGLVGAKQKQDYLGTVQNLSTLVYNQASVRSFQEKVQQLNDQTSMLTGDNVAVRDQLYKDSARDLAISNARGIMRYQGTEYAKGVVESGAYDQYINGSDKEKLLDEIRVTEKGNKSDAMTQIREQKMIQQMDANEAENEYIQLAYQGKPTTAAIMADSRLKYGSGPDRLVQRIASMNRTLNAAETATTYRDLVTRIVSPPSDPNHISDSREIMEAAPKLSGAQYNSLMKLQKDARSFKGTAEGDYYRALVNTAKNTFTRKDALGMPVDQYGEERFGNFMVSLQGAIDEGVKAGKTPRQLLDPASPDYLGRLVQAPSRMEQSRNLMMQSMGKPGVRDGTAPAAPKFPVKQPNETPAQYLQRINGAKPR